MEKFFTNIIIYAIVGFGFTVVVGLLAVLMGYPTMVLWNAVLPEVLGIKAITWTQAIIINCLCGLLFKSYSTSSSK